MLRFFETFALSHAVLPSPDCPSMLRFLQAHSQHHIGQTYLQLVQPQDEDCIVGIFRNRNSGRQRKGLPLQALARPLMLSAATILQHYYPTKVTISRGNSSHGSVMRKFLNDRKESSYLSNNEDTLLLYK